MTKTETPELQMLMEQYGESHRNPINKRLHMVCVPLIMMTTLGLFKSIPHPESWPIDFSHLVVIGASIYYARFRNLPLLLGIWVLTLICYAGLWLMRPYVLEGSILVFIIAWIGQFIGHKIEKKKPSFFQDIFFLLIGPLWVLRSVTPGVFQNRKADSP